jgi:hypothetical protein
MPKVLADAVPSSTKSQRQNWGKNMPLCILWSELFVANIYGKLTIIGAFKDMEDMKPYSSVCWYASPRFE